MRRALILIPVTSLLLLLLNACGGGDEVGIEWVKSMKQGKEMAQRQDVPLVVYYRVSEIDFCEKMENVTFYNKGVISAAKDFLWVWIDGNTKEELAMEYGVIYYPTTIFYSSSGEELARRVGLLTPQELLEVLEGVKAGRNEFAELEEKLAMEPDNLGLIYEYALALRDRGNIISARNKFVEITEADGENDAGYTDKAYMQIGVLDLSVGNASLAIKSFMAIVEKFPESKSAPKALVYTGDAYQMIDEYDNAISAYRRVMEDYPESEQATEADYRIGEMQMLEKTVEAFIGEGAEEE